VVGIDTDMLEDWMKRLEGRIEAYQKSVTDLYPRVAILETTMAQLAMAPTRFRNWTSWLVTVVSALVGGCGCVALMGVVATVVATAAALWGSLKH
jgi:hypothetical protein